MKGLNAEQYKSLIKKLVSNARAIISNEVGFSLGCLKMEKILLWLEPYEEIELPVFKSYSTETTDIPIGTARLNCSREAIRRYDEKLLPINLEYREKVLDACFEIIDKYAK